MTYQGFARLNGYRDHHHTGPIAGIFVDTSTHADAYLAIVDGRGAVCGFDGPHPLGEHPRLLKALNTKPGLAQKVLPTDPAFASPTGPWAPVAQQGAKTIPPAVFSATYRGEYELGLYAYL